MERRKSPRLLGVLAIALAALGVVSSLVLRQSGSYSDKRGEVQVVTGSSALPSLTPSAISSRVADTTEEKSSAFDISGHPERVRRSLHSQSRDLAWAPGTEGKIREVFASAGAPTQISVDCRSAGCEIKGELSGLSSSNLPQVLNRIAGEPVNKALRASGLTPDKSPTYSIISNDPVRVSFSRVVSRDIAQVER